MSSEILTLKLGEKWLHSLYKNLISIRNRRSDDLDNINNTVLFSNPLELAQNYIEPFCQEINPADRYDEDYMITKELLFDKFNEFLKARNTHAGSNQLFILSDAGMGKTSCLVMMKLLHLSSFWPKSYDCLLLKLNSNSLHIIRDIKSKRKTVLLLDSLDEDPTAYGRVKDRIQEILSETNCFLKVIITCRTQFLPTLANDPLERPGRIKIGNFICPSKYLSTFDEHQVDEYLRKRFPRKYLFISNKKIRLEAAEVVKKMGSLKCRPMLLSFIEDLLSSPAILEGESEYNIYKSLVLSWLLREEGKTKIDHNKLMAACSKLAFEMQSERKVKISQPELDSYILKFSFLRDVRSIDITGRSLLNKNSDGDFRFSHFSIQEFLVVYYILHYAKIDDEIGIYPTDFINKLLESCLSRIEIKKGDNNFNVYSEIEANGSERLSSIDDNFYSKKSTKSLLSEFLPADLSNMANRLNELEEYFNVPAYQRKKKMMKDA